MLVAELAKNEVTVKKKMFFFLSLLVNNCLPGVGSA